MRAQTKLYAAHPPSKTVTVAQPMQGTLDWRRWILPRRETRLMADEAARTGGLFIPYPLLAIMLTLILSLGGGIIGMYVKLDTMNATMIMRDADYREAQKKLENKAELQELLIRDLREKQVEMRSDLNQLVKKRGG